MREDVLKEMFLNSDFKVKKFKEVFETESGRLVLEYLSRITDITVPDFINPNTVYYKLGKYHVIKNIKKICSKEIKGEK